VSCVTYEFDHGRHNALENREGHDFQSCRPSRKKFGFRNRHCDSSKDATPTRFATRSAGINKSGSAVSPTVAFGTSETLNFTGNTF
jgi:hypothetical protein